MAVTILGFCQALGRANGPRNSRWQGHGVVNPSAESSRPPRPGGGILPRVTFELFDDRCRLEGRRGGSEGTTMSAGDKVRLSVRERQQLAAIQAMVEAGDPELAKTLTGHRGLIKAAFRQARWWACLWAKAWLERKWTGPVLFVVGFGLMLGTISISAWISVVGALLVAAGLYVSIFRWQRRRDLGAPRRPVGQSVGD